MKDGLISSAKLFLAIEIMSREAKEISFSVMAKHNNLRVQCRQINHFARQSYRRTVVRAAYNLMFPLQFPEP